MYILTAFHRCSEVLKPFLFKYLCHVYVSAGVQFQGATLISPLISALYSAILELLVVLLLAMYAVL